MVGGRVVGTITLLRGKIGIYSSEFRILLLLLQDIFHGCFAPKVQLKNTNNHNFYYLRTIQDLWNNAHQAYPASIVHIHIVYIHIKIRFYKPWKIKKKPVLLES